MLPRSMRGGARRAQLAPAQTSSAPEKSPADEAAGAFQLNGRAIKARSRVTANPN
jgi:hypothetical protein